MNTAVSARGVRAIRTGAARCVSAARFAVNAARLRSNDTARCRWDGVRVTAEILVLPTLFLWAVVFRSMVEDVLELAEVRNG